MGELLKIQRRRLIEVNTDPQRRCYNGCHFSSELMWTAWEDHESFIADEKLPERLEFWRGLNDYAVKERGKSAQAEYRITSRGTRDGIYD